MDLHRIIKDTEELGCIINFFDDDIYKEKGRHLKLHGFNFVFVNKNLNDIEKIQVILHERAHFFNCDTDNPYNSIPTYLHHIENHSEEERITNFLSLVNQEYPIDETFNYIEYMKNAYISPEYETFVRETARNLYQVNLQEKII